MLQRRRTQELERKLKVCSALEREAVRQTIGQGIGWLHRASSAKDGKGIGESLSRHMPPWYSRVSGVASTPPQITTAVEPVIGSDFEQIWHEDGFYLFPS